jgi:hypothetical protein
MKLFLISLVVISLAMVGMAVGVLFGRRSLKGSCGGRKCEIYADGSEHKSTDRKGHGCRSEIRQTGASSHDGGCHEPVVNGNELNTSSVSHLHYRMRAAALVPWRWD